MPILMDSSMAPSLTSSPSHSILVTASSPHRQFHLSTNSINFPHDPPPPRATVTPHTYASLTSYSDASKNSSSFDAPSSLTPAQIESLRRSFPDLLTIPPQCY